MALSRQRVRRAARTDAKQVEKVIAVQEAQIQALQTQVAAQDAVILGLCERYVWDYIDPHTGEVKKGRSINEDFMAQNHQTLHGASRYARIELDEDTKQQLMALRRKIKNIITQAQPALVELEDILDIPPDKRWQAEN